jgi:hypothetical protein
MPARKTYSSKPKSSKKSSSRREKTSSRTKSSKPESEKLITLTVEQFNNIVSESINIAVTKALEGIEDRIVERVVSSKSLFLYDMFKAPPPEKEAPKIPSEEAPAKIAVHTKSQEESSDSQEESEDEDEDEKEISEKEVSESSEDEKPKKSKKESNKPPRKIASKKPLSKSRSSKSPPKFSKTKKDFSKKILAKASKIENTKQTKEILEAYIVLNNLVSELPKKGSGKDGSLIVADLKKVVQADLDEDKRVIKKGKTFSKNKKSKKSDSSEESEESASEESEESESEKKESSEDSESEESEGSSEDDAFDEV